MFIGVGGAGSRIVDLLAGKLRRHAAWDRLADLTHFCAIDTNKDDLYKNRNVEPDCRFLISAFDRRAYIRRKRGQLELSEDTMVTQWVHPDYDFREAQGAGAGQIRVESRLGLYYNLEQDRAGIRRRLIALLDQATRRDNPWRDNEHRVVNILLYASVAGGTGSGGFLPLAYYLKDLVKDQGWGRANVVVTLSMPSTFLDRVEARLHDDIRANGYAALKELEFLTKLGYKDQPDQFQFHYDPDNDGRVVVDERPFNLTYIVDKPAEISLERYEHAVADAAFLQIFSPLIGQQAGEYDNYDKHQKSLALDHFAVHFGCYGTALLQLPRRDVLRYAALRYTARALDAFLVFGADNPDFRVPYGDPAFERLDQREKDRIADDKFVSWVAWRAQQEGEADERGLFTVVHEQNNKTDRPYAAVFQESLTTLFERLDELIDIAPVQPGDINAGNPSLARQLEGLRRDTAASRARVMGEELQSVLTQVKTGRLLGKLFADQEMNPLAQRLFLIHRFREAFIGPYADPEECAWLREEGGNPSDLDSEGVGREIKEAEERLQQTAEQGFLGRMFSSENKEFARAKRKAVQLFDRLAQDQRDYLKRTFWRAFETELRTAIESRLAAFRKVAEIANEQARNAADEAERFRRDPATDADSDVARYYLDTEVLRDDRRRDRLWSDLYTHLLDRSAYFDQDKIFDVITAAFAPARDRDGRPRVRDANEIVREVRKALTAQGEAIYTQALDDSGLDLQRAMELEARYLALRDQGLDLGALHADNKLDDTVRAVPDDEVRRRLLDKLQRVTDECVTLAHLDRSRMDDPSVVPARIFYAGVAPQYDSDEPHALGNLLREVASGVDFVEGWSEPDAIVLYRAMLGIPLYFFKRITDELERSYNKVSAASNRSYPLHIDAAFEGENLPNLDPVELRRARERAQAEEAARKEREDRRGRIEAFTKSAFAGLVKTGEDGGYRWEISGFGKGLAATRSGAFDAFWSLDSSLRDDLVRSAETQLRQRSVEAPDRRALVDDLKGWRDGLSKLYYAAVANEKEVEKRFLDEERSVVEALISGLES